MKTNANLKADIHPYFIPIRLQEEVRKAARAAKISESQLVCQGIILRLAQVQKEETDGE